MVIFHSYVSHYQRVIFLGLVRSLRLISPEVMMSIGRALDRKHLSVGSKQQLNVGIETRKKTALTKKYTNIIQYLDEFWNLERTGRQTWSINDGYFGIPLYYPIFRWYIQSIQFCVVCIYIYILHIYIYRWPWINNPLLCTLFDISFSGLPLFKSDQPLFLNPGLRIYLQYSPVYLDGKVKTSTTT